VAYNADKQNAIIAGLKMAAPLHIWTKEQCSVICFLISEGMKIGNKENKQGMASFLITITQEVPDAVNCRKDYADSLLG
jgi:hypothetical protein